MDIFLALLRTLVFVVATVVATVYVGRRISRGHALLWAGTTLLVTHWLIQFGWTTYAAGAPDAPADPTGWLSWVGHLLPFLAAVALIWGIGQAAGATRQARAAAAAVPDGGAGAATSAGGVPVGGVSGGEAFAAGHGGTSGAGMSGAGMSGAGASAGGAHGGASGTGASAGGAYGEAGSGWARPAPAGQQVPAVGGASAARGATGGAGGESVVSPRVAPAARTAPPGAHTPTRPRPKLSRPPGLIVPHAVPVVMTPSASHHSPLDPDPVVDLGPDPQDAVAGSAVPPSAVPQPSGWAPAPSPPVQAPTGPATGAADAAASPDRPS